MDYGAPNNIDLNILLNLSAAQANGSLGTLASGPVTPPTAIRYTAATAPFDFTLPAGQAISAFSIINRTAFDQGYNPLMFPNDDGLLNSGTYAWVQGPLPTWYVDAPVAGVYNNGAGGVGATLTTTLPNINYQDGSLMQDGDLALLIGQAGIHAKENGLYVVSGVGVAIHLTRSANFDSLAEAHNGAYQGFVNSSSYLWFTESTGPTFGVSPISIIVRMSTSTTAGEGVVAHSAQINYPVHPAYDTLANLLAQGYYNPAADIHLKVMPMPANPSIITDPLANAKPCDFTYFTTAAL